MRKELAHLWQYIQCHCNIKNVFHMHLLVVGLAGMKILAMKMFFSGMFFLPIISFASLVKQAVGSVEREHGVAESDMYTMVHLRELDSALEMNCSEEDIILAKQYVERIQNIIQRSYATKSDAHILSHSRSLYNNLDSRHDSLDEYPDRYYCVLKYVLYHLQGRLRDVHLDILKETDIIKDFDGFGDSSNIYGVSTKVDMVENMVEESNQYREKLGEKLTFKTRNQSFTYGLDDHQEELLGLSRDLMENTVYKSLYKLRSAGLLGDDDIEELKDKIEFQYDDVCNSFHGKYEIKETLTSKGHHISYDTEYLMLKVNLCGNYFVLRDLATIYEKIVVHELAHHFYYYHDYKRGEFEDICWSGPTDQRNTCGQEDFVSAYAQTMSVEDYAEHFMHWFLDIVPSETSIIKEKTAHFESLS